MRSFEADSFDEEEQKGRNQENKDRLILDRRDMFEYLKSKRGIDEKSVTKQQIEHLQRQLKDSESSK